MTRRRRVIALVILCSLIWLGAMAGLVLVLLRGTAKGPRIDRASLRKPGVKLGAGLLTKRVWYADKGLRLVYYLGHGVFDSHRGPEVCLTDGKGARFVDAATGRVTARVDLEYGGGLRPVMVGGDGDCDFMPTSTIPALFDHRGRRLWVHDRETEESMTNGMCAGDINGDGFAEFATGCAGGGQVELLDRHGRSLWRCNDGNVGCLAMTDTDGDGRLELVHDSVGGEMVIRDATGREVRRVKPATRRWWPPLPMYFSDFALVRWPRSAPLDRVAIMDADAMLLLDFRGREMARFAAPGADWLNHPRVATVRLRRDRPEYLAAVVWDVMQERSFLWLYDAHGTLVYQETLLDMCEALTALPGKDGTESLLVGADGKVWEYRAGGR